MSKRNKRIAAFGLAYAETRRAKQPARPNCASKIMNNIPVPQYMLNEQAFIREFGYSH